MHISIYMDIVYTYIIYAAHKSTYREIHMHPDNQTWLARQSGYPLLIVVAMDDAYNPLTIKHDHVFPHLKMIFTIMNQLI